jgi:hypothetical protein
MSLDVKIINGGNEELAATVKKTGSDNEPSLWTHLASVSPGFFVPIGPSVSGQHLEDNLTLNNDGTTFDAAVDGSSTPQEFIIYPDSTKDFIVTNIVIQGSDGNIKINNFLGENSGLTNGCDLSYKANDESFSFESIKTTRDLIFWASGDGFQLFSETGGDNAKATKVLEPSLILRKAGTYGPTQSTDDFIKFVVNDNISTVTELRIQARGLLVEAGKF